MNTLKNNWLEFEVPLHILDLLNDMMSFEQRVEKNEITETGNSFEEYEVKFSCSDEIFQQLKNIGCKYKGAAIERNFIYDDKEMSLHNVDARLRIRTFEDLYSANNTALISMKKPKPITDEFGAREFEAELLLKGDEASSISQLFLDRGLQIISSYERVRHYIDLDGLDAKFDVDLFTDIGRFVEVEGVEGDVMKAVALLKVDLQKTNPDPYDTIHADWCLQQGIEEIDHIKFSQPMTDLIDKEREFKELWG